jgi:hypothetical protein
MFIEESPELGYHQLGKLLQACFVVMPSNDGKTCSYGNGKKDPTLHMFVDKGCSLDTYFCATDLRNWKWLIWCDRQKFMQIPSVPYEFVGFFCRGTKAANFLF